MHLLPKTVSFEPEVTQEQKAKTPSPAAVVSNQEEFKSPEDFELTPPTKSDKQQDDEYERIMEE